MNADPLQELDRIFREQGYASALEEEAAGLADAEAPKLIRDGVKKADALGLHVPAWVEAGAADSSGRGPSRGKEWHRQKVQEQLEREWERWRYQRSKLPPEKRGPMMEPGQRQCKYCGGFFEPTTLAQRNHRENNGRCRKLAYKEREKQKRRRRPGNKKALPELRHPKPAPERDSDPATAEGASDGR